VRVGVDTGGTFTDLVTAEGAVLKVSSSPDDPLRALRQAWETVTRPGPGSAADQGGLQLALGTTVATNALLERKGGRIGLISTRGHGDVIEIARQARPSLYDAHLDRPAPLVPRGLRWDVGGRLGADGVELEPLGELALTGTELDSLDAVAVCLLHSDRNADHELALREALVARGVEVVVSCEVSPEFREYERCVTTVLDAYLRRPCRQYLLGVATVAPGALVMSSAGGLVPAPEAAQHPVGLLLSGPAGGVIAAAAAAVASGFPDAVSFDMGGTSTDVSLVLGGETAPAAERSVGGLAVRYPSLDVHTVGAGGGSIAGIDRGGALQVGPRSAGADPGPACYGRGGSAPTVTDADLVAGRLPIDGLAGLGRLDLAAARAALGRAGLSATGVIDVVDAAMVRAIRRVSVERGVDPARLSLVAFGGAGPLHACALAESLRMPRVIVPPRAGVLSAVGMLAAARQVDLVASWADPADHGVGEALGELAQRAAGRLSADDGPIEIRAAVDCRYLGQSHELRVPTVADFAEEHRLRNGFVRPDWPVEVIALRVTAFQRSSVELAQLPPTARRGRHRGPKLIAEPDCTVFVAPGWLATADEVGSWVLTRESA
jgi:N-methylhydantoinase A/oxoprolinase/acetone carboxylase beta subunit